MTVSTNRNLFEQKGEPKQYRTEVLLLNALPLGWTSSLMMMMMSTFIAHDSINLNAQCTERGREGSREKVIKNFFKGTWCKVIHRTQPFNGYSSVATTLHQKLVGVALNLDLCLIRLYFALPFSVFISLWLWVLNLTPLGWLVRLV